MSHWLDNLKALPDFTPQVVPPGTPTCGCGEFLTMEHERNAGECADCAALRILTAHTEAAS